MISNEQADKLTHLFRKVQTLTEHKVKLDKVQSMLGLSDLGRTVREQLAQTECDIERVQLEFNKIIFSLNR